MLSHPTSPPPEQTPGLVDAETSTLDTARHDAWVDLADGMVQGCPAPSLFQVSGDMSWAWLTVGAAEDVATWAAYLGLTHFEINQLPRHDASPAVVLQSVHTFSYGVRSGATWTVSHVHHEPRADVVESAADGAPLDGAR